ncbi:hypothetical protein DFH28DRAFT_1102792 [Melampsora americana]|nr:hypothetical protein DFH28DRAFT_1102792 [Melampsora americana]
MRLAFVAAGAVVIGATVSEARSIPPSPRSPSKVMKRQAYQNSNSAGSGMPSNQAHDGAPNGGDGQMMGENSQMMGDNGQMMGDGSSSTYQAPTQRDALPGPLGDIISQGPLAEYAPGIQNVGQGLQSLGTPGSNGYPGVANTFFDGLASTGPAGQDIGGTLSKLGSQRNVFGPGGTVPGALTTLGSYNNGPMIGAIHTSGETGPPVMGNQGSNANPALLYAPAAIPSPIRNLLPPIHNPLGPGDVNVTTVPAKEKGGSSRGFQTGFGGDSSMITAGAHAPNGTIVPTANVGGTDALGGSMAASEGPKGININSLNGNDTSHTTLNPTADAASYTANQ